MNWPLIKDIAGFIGAVLVLIPWLRDFNGRWQADQLKRIQAKGRLAELTADLTQKLDKWLSKAKTCDLVVTISGAVLIAISFLISVILDL